MLSEATDYQPVLLTRYSEAIELLGASEPQGIMHLHGHYRWPEFVVLGITSYVHLTNDQKAQFVQHLIGLGHLVTFVGCSDDGLSDANLGKLRIWLEGWRDAGPRHFNLVRTSEDRPGRGIGNIYSIPYGHSHAELPRFLNELYEDLYPSRPITISSINSAGKISDPIRSLEQTIARPLVLLGRGSELKEIVAALLENCHVMIAGGPGLGKTSLAVSALYDSCVKDYYSDRRVFISFEELKEPRAIFQKLALALGLQPHGDDGLILRELARVCNDAKTVAIIDNLETIVDSDAQGTTQALGLLATIENLAIVVTSCETIIKWHPNVLTIDDLPKLSLEVARDAFLTVTEGRFEGDNSLGQLLDLLDGHPLSIDIVAAQAIDVSSLSLLVQAWLESKAAILRKPDQQEGRLTSVRASLSLSLSSHVVSNSPLLRRFIAVLGHLPAGAKRGRIPSLLGERGRVSKRDVLEIERRLRKAHLVERRNDDRLRLLNPIRESVKKDLPCQASDQKRLFEVYGTLIKKAGMIKTPRWPAVKEEVNEEFDNLDAVLNEICRKRKYDDKAIDLIGDLVDYAESGHCTITTMRSALSHELVLVAPEKLSRIEMLAGDIASGRNNHVEALTRYSTAVRMFDEINSQEDAAICRGQMAEIYRRQSKGEEAKRLYLKLLDDHSSNKRDERWLAYSHLGLAELAVRRGDFSEADTHSAAASAYFGKTAYRAEAMAYQYYLAERDFYLLKWDEAKMRYQTVAEFSFPIEQTRQYSNSTYRLAQISLVEGRFDEAVKYFSEVLPLFRRLGGSLSEGKTILQLILLARANIIAPGLTSSLDDAFQLICRDPEDNALDAWKSFKTSLASVVSDKVFQMQTRAKEQWTRIGRRDLAIDFVEIYEVYVAKLNV